MNQGRYWFFCLFLLTAWIPGISRAQSQNGITGPALFQEVPDSNGLESSPLKFLRKHTVQIQTALLEGLPGRFSHPGSKPDFQLNLFDDVNPDWKIDRVRVRPGKGWVAWGREANGGYVVMAYRKGVLQANVFIPGKGKYEIRSLGNGLHRISERDPSDQPPQGGIDALPQPPGLEPWLQSQGIPSSYPQDISSGCANSAPLKVSQLLVLYTPLALTQAGGTIAMNTLIDLAWGGMNMALYNSGVTAEMEMVGCQEVSYTETGSVKTDLLNMSNPTYFPQMPTLMSTYGAHFVSLVVGVTTSDTAAGIAYMPGQFSAFYWPWADICMAHELGHNYGCNHDRTTAGVPTGAGYNYGYKLNAGGVTYIDVMSYQPGNYNLYYSNPAENFMGLPTGVDPSQPTAADNALVINQNFPDTPYTGPNPLPTVQVTYPSDGTYFPSITPLTLTASASAPGGTVEQVDFMINDQYAGTSTSPPFQLAWTPPSAGTYFITAVAVDNLGGMKISCDSEIYVGVPTATATPSPTPSFTPTPTFTFTPTPTPTWTGTPTWTPTYSPPTATPVLNGCCVDSASVSSTLISWTWGGGGGVILGTPTPLPSGNPIYPIGMYEDKLWNLYFCNSDFYTVMKFASGTANTIAGNGASGYSGDGGLATLAGLVQPVALTEDSAGNIYICDAGGNRIRKVSPAGIISTFAGNGIAGYSGDGGPASGALLNNPYGIGIDGAGNIYIADTNNNAIRKVSPGGTITTICGNGTAGYAGDGGLAASALLHFPEALGVDPSGNIYFYDFGNYRVRKINTAGTISLFAGNGTGGYFGDGGPAVSAYVGGVEDFAFCGGGVYFTNNYALYESGIRVVSGGVINTIIQAPTGGPVLGGTPYFTGGLTEDPQGDLEYGYYEPAPGVTCSLCHFFTASSIDQLAADCHWTSTPTPTGTLPTATRTSTPTSSPTNSPTPTATQSPTPTVTGTPSLTPTPTSQIIVDNFPTFTPTNTPTNTPTITPTITPTFTPTCVTHVWPNPYNPARAVGGMMKFDCLTVGATISIYTITGEMVRDLSAEGGMAQWNGKNSAGMPVAPGIYLYVISGAQNAAGAGKFLLTR